MGSAGALTGSIHVDKGFAADAWADAGAAGGEGVCANATVYAAAQAQVNAARATTTRDIRWKS
jgi:hypothetical protein